MKLNTVEELVDFFEDVYDESVREAEAKATAKAISKSISDRIKDYAETIDVTSSQLKKVYSYWKTIKESGGSVEDAGDEFELMAILDSYFRREKSE